MEKNREELKQRFKKGDKPTENDYHNLLDSYVHKSEDPYFKSNDLPTTSKTRAGIVEQATFEEALQDSPLDINKFVSPQGIKRAIEKFAPKSPVISVNGDVGAVVIPSYEEADTGWQNVTLETSTGAVQIENQIRYRKKLGIIYFEGQIAVSNTSNGDIILFTLPTDYIPTSKKVFNTIAYSGNSMVQIEILTNGQLIYKNDINNRAFNLSGIFFIQD